MINAKLMELFSKPHFNDNIHIFVITSPVFVTRTHILLLGLKEDARSKPGMTDSMLLINAGKAQEPTDS
jgi:hypothetical protein